MAKQPKITVRVLKGTDEIADRIRVWSTGFLSETRVVNDEVDFEQQVLELAQGFASITGIKIPKVMYELSTGDYCSEKPVEEIDEVEGEGDE